MQYGFGHQFSYTLRTDANLAAYDTRYVGTYRYPFAWIAGWWDSYYGYHPHTFAVPLLTSYPYHQPWVVTNELESPSAQAQRKPLKPSLARRAWWAVELSTENVPSTLEIPDLSLHAPVRDITAQGLHATMTTPAILNVPDLWAVLPESSRILVQQPLNVLAGVSNRTKPESILTWVWYAALTSGLNPDYPPVPTWPGVVQDFRAYTWDNPNLKVPVSFEGLKNLRQQFPNWRWNKPE